MRTRQGIATPALLASLCAAWVMVVAAVIAPGEHTLLVWAGIVTGTGTVPPLVLAQRRRAAEAAFDEAYRLGLEHAGPELLKVHPPTRRQGGDSL